MNRRTPAGLRQASGGARTLLVILGTLGAGLMVWVMSPGPPGSRAWRPDPATPPTQEQETAPPELMGDLGTFPMLETGSPEDLRQVVAFCRGAGPKDLVGLRHAALHSADPLVVGNSLQALGRMQAVLDDSQLMAMLTDHRMRVRQELVRALGQSGDERAVEILAPILDDPDLGQRRLVIQALGRLDLQVARDVLLSYEGRASDEERPFLRAALRR